MADAPSGAPSVGETYLLYGRAQGFSAEVSLASLFEASGSDGSEGTVLRGVESGDESGTAVTGIGDLNDDGIDDLLSYFYPHGHRFLIDGLFLRMAKEDR